MLIEKVKKTIIQYRMINSGEQVLLAFSGGIDSTALLWILLDLRDKLDFTLSLAHLNHMIRGEEANKDEKFAKDIAKKEGLHIRIARENVCKLAEKERTSIEDAGRKARYKFLYQSAEKFGANKIAVAHNQDDKIETFLINLLRGAGTRGLSAMKPVKGKLIRPLLECDRKEIETFLLMKGLEYRVDSSNLDIKYTRNKIRHRLIPYLEKNFNPNIKQILARESEILREDDNYIRENTQQIFENFCSQVGDTIGIPIVVIAELSLAIKRRLLRIAIEKIKGDIRRISWVHINSILQLLEEDKKGKGISLPQGLIAKREAEKIVIESKKMKKKIEFSLKVSIPDRIKIKEIGQEFIITLKLISDIGNSYLHGDNCQAYLDADKVGKELSVRNRREGDRFFPLGCKGNKKLKEFFIDKKVPRQKRDSIPLFISNDEIAWVADLAIGEHFKIEPSTQNVIIIERG